jgi:hypothetical protein
MESIVRTIQNARDEFINALKPQRRVVDVIHILTNDDSEWLALLKETLAGAGWEKVLTSHDLELDQEQIGVGMVVDMDIARRAAVFIGNGVRRLCFRAGFLCRFVLIKHAVVVFDKQHRTSTTR